MNLSNLGIFFAKSGPGPFIYVRPVGGPESTSNIGENPNINNLT